jgi:hypothetical protein
MIQFFDFAESLALLSLAARCTGTCDHPFSQSSFPSPFFDFLLYLLCFTCTCGQLLSPKAETEKVGLFILCGGGYQILVSLYTLVFPLLETMQEPYQ